MANITKPIALDETLQRVATALESFEGIGIQGPPGPGVPAGGTTGKILAKKTGTDYDTEWVDAPSGGGDVDSVNGQTGTVVLDAGDINVDDSALTPKTVAAELSDLGTKVQDVVVVSSTQPQSANTKIWIDSSESTPVQVPTNEEFTTAVGEINRALSVCVDEDTGYENVPLDVKHDGFYDTFGDFHADNYRGYAIVSATAGEQYKLSTKIRSTALPAIVYFNNDTFIGYEKTGSGTNEYLVDYPFTVPSGVNKVVVQAVDITDTITLKKYYEETVFKAYTKSETDDLIDNVESQITAAKYGVKWEISNSDDLGQRCFGAIGKTATIGVGTTDGASDFDTIYPWSDIKRCNIKENANGAAIVTFEGETGFALDGTNGDVFVRIPKFYYERYRKNGYEYRVVSEAGTNVHPAFIEDGKELDEIFIGAFEGYIDSNDKMRSIGGVLPTSNLVPQDFLDAAQENGTNYSLYDNRCVDAIWTLAAIEYGCRNTNRIWGYGLANFEQPATAYDRNKVILAATGTNTVRTSKWTAAAKEFMPIGSNITVCDTNQINILTQAKILSCVDGTDYTEWTFDGAAIDVNTSCFIGSAVFNTNWCENAPSGALNWHTGRADWISGSTTRNAIRYRWIENPVGNLWHFLPDVTFNGLQMYVCDSMKDYVMHKYTTPYKPVSALFTQNSDNGNKSDITGANYWITDLNSDTFAKGTDFGRTYDKSLTSSKAFGAYYYLYSTNVIISNGGGFDHLWRCNMLTNRAWIAPTDKWYLYGARMMYKKIS